MAKRQVFILREEPYRNLMRLRKEIDFLLDEEYTLEPVHNVFPLLFHLYSYAWRFGVRGFYKKVFKDF